ncbi:MAG TPA: FISUMP domain-containing protein [bacterium]|nr:FISUMP domain-containing protein [bacterium]HPT29878.1 FISUMP domain-containing protein [bacterium]
MKIKRAFTLVELLVVIAIIGLLASISIIALNTARAKSRDAKRVADIKQISTALELFFNDMGRYPTALEFASGSIYSTSSGATTTYLANIPVAPATPDGDCTASSNTYSYTSVNNGEKYTLNFCLGGQVSSLTSGATCGTSMGLLSQDCCEVFPVQYEGGPYDADGMSTTTGGYYRTVKIGDQCWLKDNLNVGTMIAVGASQTNNSVTEKYCMNGSAGNCSIYGGIYSREEAIQYNPVAGGQGICPAGWHIPTDIEQDALDQYLTNSGQVCDGSRINDYSCNGAGTKMKVGGSSGFNAPMAGASVSGSFIAFGSGGYFWSSTVPYGSVNYGRILLLAGQGTGRYRFGNEYGLSVRCIRN